MDWLASAAAWLRELLDGFAWPDALKPAIDGLPDWVLLAACVMIVAVLVLAVVGLAARMPSRPKSSEPSRFTSTQDAVVAHKKGAAKPAETSSMPAHWTVSKAAKLRNAVPLDFDKVVALAEDAEFAAEGVTVRGIAAKAQSMGLGVVTRSAPAAPILFLFPKQKVSHPQGRQSISEGCHRQ
jgi:hypothetical protein